MCVVTYVQVYELARVAASRVTGEIERVVRGVVSTRTPRLRQATHLLPWGHGNILFQINMDTWYRNKSNVTGPRKPLLRRRELNVLVPQSEKYIIYLFRISYLFIYFNYFILGRFGRFWVNGLRLFMEHKVCNIDKIASLSRYW